MITRSRALSRVVPKGLTLFARLRDDDKHAQHEFVRRYEIAIRRQLKAAGIQHVVVTARKIVEALLEAIKARKVRSAAGLDTLSKRLIGELQQKRPPSRVVVKRMARTPAKKAARRVAAVKKTTKRRSGGTGATIKKKSTTSGRKSKVVKSVEASETKRERRVAITIPKSMNITGMPRPAPALDMRPDDLQVDDLFGDLIAGSEDVTLPPVPAQPEGVLYPVWFGTNRKRLNSKEGGTSVEFGHERSALITHGRVDVWIPESHEFGTIDGTRWQKVLHLDRAYGTLRVKNTVLLENEAFWAGIREQTLHAEALDGGSHALIFIHGFNNTFRDSAIRAAQIGCDLKVRGATAFFSWPSVGGANGIASYGADSATIDASEPHITKFLVEFVRRCGAKTVHLIVHSMGNRGVLRAIQRIATTATQETKVNFGQIILAAPDVDRDVFIELAAHYKAHCARATLYSSSADRAVHLSAFLHANPRAGYFEPYTITPGVDTVAVPDFDVDLLGHAYFAAAAPLLHDIFDLVHFNASPDVRQRLRPRIVDGLRFWEIRK
jgi:esterase/lipase superfamily enzyme